MWEVGFRASVATDIIRKNNAAQLRQPIKNSLVLCHLKTLRLYTGLFKCEPVHYLTKVARVKSRYWG
mgnify:CR=1 FL=1